MKTLIVEDDLMSQCLLAQVLTERGHDVTLHCASGSEVAGVRLVTVPAPRDAAVALVMPARWLSKSRGRTRMSCMKCGGRHGRYGAVKPPRV